MVVTSSYLAVSWLALPIFTRIGVVIVSWTQAPEAAGSTFTAVTWARNDGGRVAATSSPNRSDPPSVPPGAPGDRGPVNSMSPGGRGATTARNVNLPAS